MVAEHIGLSDIALHFSNLAAFPTALSEYLDTTGKICEFAPDTLSEQIVFDAAHGLVEC